MIYNQVEKGPVIGNLFFLLGNGLVANVTQYQSDEELISPCHGHSGYDSTFTVGTLRS